MASIDPKAIAPVAELESPSPESGSKLQVLNGIAEDAQMNAGQYLQDTEVPEGGE